LLYSDLRRKGAKKKQERNQNQFSYLTKDTHVRAIKEINYYFKDMHFLIFLGKLFMQRSDKLNLLWLKYFC